MQFNKSTYKINGKNLCMEMIQPHGMNATVDKRMLCFS